MHLDENEREIYTQLNGKQQNELSAMFKSTEFWNKLPKLAAVAIASVLVIAFIF